MGEKHIVAEADKSEWKITALDSESFHIHRLCDTGDQYMDTLDITIDYWYLGIIRVKEESLCFIRDKKKLLFPNHTYYVYYPPFSICNIGLDKTSIDVEIYASKRKPASEFPIVPLLYDAPDAVVPETYENAKKVISSLGTGTPIGISSNPSGIGQRIKAKIEKSYNETTSLSEMATDFSLSPSLFSMYFKKAYHTTPSHYRKSLRVIAAVVALLRAQQEKSITSIALDSGYRDISRFNKQFKSILDTTPRNVKS